MRVYLPSLLLVSSLVLSSATVLPAPYLIYQITDNDTDDREPLISDNGMIVWEGHDGNDVEIMLFNGSEIVPLSDNDTVDGDARINNSGEVVWQEGESDAREILLFDGLSVTRLTNNGVSDTCPDINNAGQVSWIGDGELWLYSGGSETQLTGHDYSPRPCPDINDAGHIAFGGSEMGVYGLLYPIYRFNGTSISMVTWPGHANRDGSPRMNNSGVIAYIRAYEGPGWFEELNLTSYGSYLDSYTSIPHINNLGFVVWFSGYWVRLFDGNEVMTISETGWPATAPHINDAGITVWQAYSSGDPARTYEIFVHDGAHIFRLTENAVEDQHPWINGSGKIVWQAWDGTDWEILLAVPATDLDGDGFPGAAVGGGDCVDDPSGDPPVCAGCTCGEEACGACARCIHPRAMDFCGDGADGNCDGRPGAPEVCDNGRDDDCDSLTDMEDEDCWKCATVEDCEDGDACTVDECTGHLCERHTLNCSDGDACTDDSCDPETGCVTTCNATDLQDPCCLSPACAGTPVCVAPCIDIDGDGYGAAASPYCAYPEKDCHDNPYEDPLACSSCTCGEEACAVCARCVHPGAEDICGDNFDSNCDGGDGVPEIPGNGIDDDCDPASPAYPEPANTMAAAYGRSSLVGSGVFNAAALLLLPTGAVLLLRSRERKGRGSGCGG